MKNTMWRFSYVAAILSSAFLSLISVPTAFAWGVSLPGGLPVPCRSEDGPSRNLRFGLGAGGFDTTLRFDDSREVDVNMTSMAGSGSILLNDRWSARVSLGVVANGSINNNHDVQPGPLISAGAEYHARDGEGVGPAIDLSLSLSASWVRTRSEETGAEADFRATDLRLGVRSTWNVDNRFFPYGVVRVFGGPVNWEMDGRDVTGTDVHHFQVAAGLAGRAGDFGLFAEFSGLGEKALNVGISRIW